MQRSKCYEIVKRLFIFVLPFFWCLEEFRRLYFLKKLIKFQIFFDLFIYVSKYICTFVLNKFFRSGQVPFELLPGKNCLVGFTLATPAQFLNPALQIRNTFPKYCLLLNLFQVEKSQLGYLLIAPNRSTTTIHLFYKAWFIHDLLLLTGKT